MISRNRPLVAGIAAVAVTAAAGGGLLAAAESPRTQGGGSAAPLAAAVTATSGKLDAAQLQEGHEPQITYVRGRTVLGGVGTPVKVPGKAEIVAAARLWDTTLTVQVAGATSSSLMIQDHTGKVVDQIKGVDSLTTSSDGKYAAYASGGQYADGRPGGRVYFQEPGTKPTAVLDRPADYNVRVLAVVDRHVYFTAARSLEAAETLFQWDVDAKDLRTYAYLSTPVSVAFRNNLVAWVPVFTDSGLCSALTDTDTGRQVWRTCQYRLDRFSPTNGFVVGLPPNTGAPYGVQRTAALDTKTGKLLREWTAPSLRGAVAEDDDHLLLLWHDQPEPQSRSALVRCTVSTGQCELATPLSSEPLLLGS
ncbi:hypothetical protein ACWCOV_23520 [Kribbella sp. NPDC002412]